MAFSGAQQKCKVCDKTVGVTDQLTADGVAYHKSCFKCNHCEGTLKCTNDPGHLICQNSSASEHCSTDSEPQPTMYLSPISSRVPPTTKKSRTGNFTIDEDKLIVSAWLNINLDEVHGIGQKHKQYWHRVWDFFHEHKTFESDRTQNSLMHRWSTIQLAINKFCVCYAQIEAKKQSGVNEHDKIRQAKVMYRSMHKATFQYLHCWNELRHQPKWMENCQKKKSAKKVTTMASPTASSPVIPGKINLGEDGGFEDVTRSPGRKAEKERLSKRKGKGRADDEGSNAAITELLKEIREEKKQMSTKMELYEKTYQQEQQRLAHEQGKLRLKQQAEDERIMLIDTSGMPPMQKEYYHRRQLEILQKGFPEA